MDPTNTAEPLESAPETTSPATPRRVFTAGRIMLVCAFLIPLLWLGALRVLVMPTSENSQDSLYHAMMAKLGPSVYMAKEFPWTQMSVW